MATGSRVVYTHIESCPSLVTHLQSHGRDSIADGNNYRQIKAHPQEDKYVEASFSHWPTMYACVVSIGLFVDILYLQNIYTSIYISHLLILMPIIYDQYEAKQLVKKGNHISLLRNTKFVCIS